MSEWHYDDDHVAFLEALWGEGYLSPGGADEVSLLLDGLDLSGKRVLDIGSGSGGVTASLVRDHRAASVVGIDVEAPVCEHARRRMQRAGLDDSIEIVQVEPGPFPFDDASFDVVFSKDSIVHIADKHALSSEAFRVLRPGGWFVASDWMTSHDGPPSPEMAHYLELEDLGFGMASPNTYRAALEVAGFADVELRNRNLWYREQAAIERDRLAGPERPIFDAALGADEVAAQIRTWDAMLVVLRTGEHCPHHIRGRKWHQKRGM